MGLHIYHSSRQPSSVNYCSQANASCSHLCLPKLQTSSLILDDKLMLSPRIQCACPDSMILSADNRICICPDNMILSEDNRSCKEKPVEKVVRPFSK